MKTAEYDRILKRLRLLSASKAVEGMARYGINPEKTLGVSIPNLRKIAKETGKSHTLAGKLWSSGIHEARILAGMVECPEEVTEHQMEQWVGGFDSWDVCDGCCNTLLRKSNHLTNTRPMSIHLLNTPPLLLISLT